MTLGPELESGLAVSLFAILALILAALARVLIRMGTSAANIKGSVKGIGIEITGGIAAWLGAFIVMLVMWLEYALPSFMTHELWHVKGQIRFEESVEGAWREAHKDVEIYVHPPGWEVNGGLLDVTVALDPEKVEHARFPTIEIFKSDKHRKPRINLNRRDKVEIMDGNIIDIGRIDLELLPETSGLPSVLDR